MSNPINGHWKWLGPLLGALFAGCVALSLRAYDRRETVMDSICCTDRAIGQDIATVKERMFNVEGWEAWHTKGEDEFRRDMKARLDRIERKLDGRR